MTDANTDYKVLDTITELVEEERALYGQGSLSDADVTRLEAIGIELDQTWDLMRQREALREFGMDPNAARMRSASVVEKYEQ